MVKHFPTAIFFIYYFFILLSPSLFHPFNPNEIIRIDFSSSKIILPMIFNSLLILMMGLMLTKTPSATTIKHKIDINFFCIIFIIFLILMAINFLLEKFFRLFDVKSPSLIYLSREGVNNSFILLLLCLIVGYSEEILFRHAVTGIFPTLKRSIAYGLMSFLFGLAHLGHGLYTVIFSIIAGAILSYFYILLAKKYSYTLALHAVANAHALYNFTIVKLLKSFFPT